LHAKDEEKMTNTNESVTLKPCPFCGGKARFRMEDTFGAEYKPDQHSIECTLCYARSSSEYGQGTALAMWNRRSPAHPSEAGQKILDEVRNACSYSYRVGNGLLQERNQESLYAASEAFANRYVDAREDRLRAAASAPPEADKKLAEGWKTIEDAPNDPGSYLGVVVGMPWSRIQFRPVVREVYFNREGEWTNGECVALDVTHWQPLPPPPAPQVAPK
jgi:Lar family restriction alleviation protein